MTIATFAAGCFWGVQAAFQQVPGVELTRAGYTGGERPDPTYQDVCSDQTGHAEAVQIEYNPDQVSYQQLLEVFFSLHDPTELNRQGPDIGSQYRSVIFYHSEEQKQTAIEFIDTLEKSGRFNLRIVTTLEPAGTFWPAEEYHQSYYVKMGRRYGGL
jgi:peptide-methionine (S)-S-oxide reductase